MTHREIIIRLFYEALYITDAQLLCELEDTVGLLETGLDSLGFAILVARLEEELGFDPFVDMDEAIYPQSFGEFVAIYDRYTSTH